MENCVRQSIFIHLCSQRVFGSDQRLPLIKSTQSALFRLRDDILRMLCVQQRYLLRGQLTRGKTTRLDGSGALRGADVNSL